MSTGDPGTGGDVLHSARAYDVLVWVLTLGRERQLRERMVDLARLGRGESVLDVGCGTGALALAAQRRVGATGSVCGVDPSPEMIARARRKATKAGADVRFETAAVEALPFPDATFDAVLSSLMLHHLTEEGRRQGVNQIARVLRPEGKFLAVDLGGGKGTHAGWHRRRRPHADFDFGALIPLFTGAGLQILDEGPINSPPVVGLRNLRFVLAGASSP